MRTFLPAIATATVAAIATPAAASEYIYFDSDHSSYYGDHPTGTSLLFSGGGVNVRASAWTIKTSNDTIYKASLGVWPDGLGVKSYSDNSHTVDNGSGYLDFILLQFDQVVELERASFQTGWHNMNDTDATIGYAISALPFGTLPALNGEPDSDLGFLNLYASNSPANSGGNSGDSYRYINPNGNVGNLWLIGASFNNPDGRYKLDGFKLEKLKFEVTTPLPEPSTWMMMILGFGLVGGTMRSQRRKKLTVSYT